jgi:hypothetical protein
MHVVTIRFEKLETQGRQAEYTPRSLTDNLQICKSTDLFTRRPSSKTCYKTVACAALALPAASFPYRAMINAGNNLRAQPRQTCQPTTKPHPDCSGNSALFFREFLTEKKGVAGYLVLACSSIGKQANRLSELIPAKNKGISR